MENNYERNNPLKKYDLGFSYCAYLGINLDYYPVENLRLYLLWAQTEFQLPSELTSKYGKMLPDGYGIQTGFDLVIPTQQKGYYTGNLEVLYTAPYLYVEQSPDWSLINFRFDKMNQHTDVASWIGTPYGPDTFALITSFGYKQPEKWSANLEYLLSMKGCINADTLLEKAQSKKDPADPTLYPSYYPSVSEKLGLEDTEDAIKRSRASGLTGTIQYKNSISLSGEYYITKKLIAAAKGTYVFVFNNNHEKNNFQQGLQLKLSLTYNIF